ncbi:cyclodeaminase/cyclohydrolase family protein [Cohnella sp. 56]|uniref:cyclodeaminase/cyclohydrolase family protein n=1 Tax=Cohnella sp. 56 TaxID=3113722 RepID=UPI0030EACA74
MSDVSWDHSIRSFLASAGSANPTPGGGSVAAVVAALGAAMTSMVGHLSQGDKYAPIREEVEETLKEMSRLSVEYEALMHADIASFDGYMAALRMPKLTGDDIEKRRTALREATVRAIEMPLRLIEQCRSGLEQTLRIVEGSNKHVASDLGIGAILLEAAAQSALLTAEINFGSLQDEQSKARYADRASALMLSIERAKAEVLNAVRRRMCE